MLTLNGEPFSTGRARYLDSDPAHGPAARIHVPIKVGQFEVLALVDTGAQYSVLGRELAEALGLPELSWRKGNVRGKLVRTDVVLLAEQGESLMVDATVFVPDDAEMANFIGYSNFLDRVRFAVDPQRNHIYFGQA
jgi:predicted aspartyl protease